MREREVNVLVREESVEGREKEVESRERAVASSKGRNGKPLEEVKNLGPTFRRGPHETPVSRRANANSAIPPSSSTSSASSSSSVTNTQATPRPTSSNPMPSSATFATQLNYPSSVLETPITRPSYTDTLPSAMKGVVLTTTGEVVSTPHPNELSNLFNSSPKVGLDFAKIFDTGRTVKMFNTGDEDRTIRRPIGGGARAHERMDSALSGSATSSGDEFGEEPPSPSARKEVERRERLSDVASLRSGRASAEHLAAVGREQSARRGSRGGSRSPQDDDDTITTSSAVPSRLRRPSIRSANAPRRYSSVTPGGDDATVVRPLGHPHLQPPPASAGPSSGPLSAGPTGSMKPPAAGPITRSTSVPALPGMSTKPSSGVFPSPRSAPPAEYDHNDPENLPSPFIKRVLPSASSSSLSTESSAGSSSASGSTGLTSAHSRDRKSVV